MKTTVITSILAFVLLFSISAVQARPTKNPDMSGTVATLTNLHLSVHILSAEEAKELLYPETFWIEFCTSDEIGASDYKLLDTKGNVVTRGILENGKARANITNLPKGSYLIVVGQAGNRTIQPIQIL